jgi:hypothetical protein
MSMGLKETEQTTEMVVERMETSMSTMEQMSFDAINITDRLVTLTSEAREHASVMRTGTEEERNEAFDGICKNLNEILDTAFTVNNVSHELEKEIIYQRDTTDTIKQIIEFLYAMSEM